MRWLDEWFIALDVDDNICLSTYFLCGFLNAVGTAFVIRASHHDTAAKLLDGFADAVVVRGYPYFTEYGRGLFVNVLYDGLVAKQCQRFARETCRGIAGGNNSCEIHNVS